MIIEYKDKQLAVFSDTHGKHRKLPIQKVDIAIHLGDACTAGNEKEFSDFLEWFSEYPAKYKLFVAGNHELQWEFEPNCFLDSFPKNIIFLENRFIRLEEIAFMSVPARMGLYAMPVIKQAQKVDILLTHAPPIGVLDNGLGCLLLKKFVSKLQPTYHLFGHIHETSGQSKHQNGTLFINTAVEYLK
ncbi:MAG TPA: metallophosphatase domain-containing protein [Flavobacterium sp.]|nr:metallophosphatase domain-containing protein [Flavobacterium sp.]